MRKKILIDLSFIRAAPYSGVAKYAYRIIDYIIDSKREESYALLLDNISANFIKEKYPQFETLTIGNSFASKIPIFRTLWLSFSFRNAVNRSAYGLVFCPWANYITCLKSKKIIVSVIHDLQAIIDCKGVSLYVSKKMFDMVVKNSAKLVTISDFSKKQISSFYPNAIVENWGNSVSLPQDNLPLEKPYYPYILFVGRLCKMKNIVTLVKAYARIFTECNGRKLVVVGKKNDYWNKVIVPIIKSNHMEDKVIVLGDLSENQLAATFRDADLFVFPSLREGFGYPPVEASIMCTPVLSTKEDSLDEVSLGLWYTYENALDDEELAGRIKLVLEKLPSKERLSEIRTQMLAHYSPCIVCKKICDRLEDLNEKYD